MEIINYENLKEKLYFEEMDNGLKVYLLQKNGFSKTYGLFSTKFGSIDNSFIPLNQDEMITVPDGIAHFLEHKMFEMKDGDVMDQFARLGASTNAFTSSSRTSYLFNTTSNEDACIELLLDFVQEIYLTDETVEKEKGIIAQEIGMYDDDPDWRGYFGSIQNLYHNHPVKVDIAGTVESISEIDKETLELCYHTFYHPSNMMLFVVGNIDPEKTMDLIRNNQNSKSFNKANEIVRKVYDEPKDVYCTFKELNMDVNLPKLSVTIKINDLPKDAKERLKREIGMTILFDLLFSKSSSLYEQWTNDGLINDSFYGAYNHERDFSFINFEGDTLEPMKLKDTLYDFIDHINDYRFSEKEFEMVKRKNIGMLISLLNSPESIANMFSRFYFEDIIFFEIIEELNHLKLDDLYDLYKFFNKEYISSFIVKPL